MRAARPPRPASRVRFGFAALTLLLAGTLAASAWSAPVVGFRENFSGTAFTGWSSGSALSNPGANGALGPTDGYLNIAVPGPLAGNLGAFSASANYVGDWTAAGITQVRLWLRDVNAQEDLEIHVALGNGALGNFWQCNTGFIPPHGEWAPFVVDLTAAANFSQIGFGTGTFAAAKQNVDRILVRHDKAPYIQQPNTIVGDFGLDQILLTNGITGVDGPGHLAVGQPLRLAPAAPNPSRGAVTFRMEASEATPVRLQIVDAQGRIIRHAETSAAAAGPLSWTWDGQDDHGRAAPAGYYRVRAIGRSGGMSQPLVRVN
jgi:hypothetical protein